MAYDLVKQSNSLVNMKSRGIFEPSAKKPIKLKSQLYKLTNTMVILGFIRIILLILFINIILKSNKYKILYNSDTNKIIVIINLIFVYIQIIVTIYALYGLKKYYSLLHNNNFIKNSLIVFLILFVVFIISVIHLTHILINFDENKNKNIHFLTHYFNFFQIINLIIIIFGICVHCNN